MTTDRAGQSFEGRRLPEHPFAGDTGEASAALTAAIANFRVGDEARETALMTALRDARLLVGVVAAPVPDSQVGGGVADAHSEMATVTLTSPDGVTALPVFSSVAALAAWRPDARPMPVTSGDAARSAITEGASVMVLDVGTGGPILRGSMVWALAMQQEWVPAHRDAHVARAVDAACAPEEAIAWQDVNAAADGGIVVELGLVPGLDQDSVMGIARRVAERVAADGEARARIDGIQIGLRKA